MWIKTISSWFLSYQRKKRIHLYTSPTSWFRPIELPDMQQVQRRRGRRVRRQRVRKQHPWDQPR